jgi:hypothetical protein
MFRSADDNAGVRLRVPGRAAVDRRGEGEGAGMSVERLTDPKAGNWVDRNQGPEAELTRVLQPYLGRGASLTLVRLREHVQAIRGLVEADGGETQVAKYLDAMEREAGLPDDPARPRRTAAVALWHIVKCAEVRDRARRLLDDGSRADG